MCGGGVLFRCCCCISIWSIASSVFWVSACCACNPEKACSRTDTRSSFISEEVGSTGVEATDRTEGGLSAEEYAECTESESESDCGLRNATVTNSCCGKSAF